jgi:hypothetical protein
MEKVTLRAWQLLSTIIMIESLEKIRLRSQGSTRSRDKGESNQKAEVSRCPSKPQIGDFVEVWSHP